MQNLQNHRIYFLLNSNNLNEIFFILFYLFFSFAIFVQNIQKINIMGCLAPFVNSHRKQKGTIIIPSGKKKAFTNSLKYYDNTNDDQQLSSNKNAMKISQKLSSQAIKQAQQILQEHYLFSHFSRSQRLQYCQKLIQFNQKQGAYLFRQGDIGEHFYIITEGEVVIQKNKVSVVTYKKNDTFGQLALLYSKKRFASAKCVKDCSFLLMKAYTFKSLTRSINIKNYQTLLSLINEVQIFHFLNSKQRNLIIKNMIRIPYKANQVIFQLNSYASCFFIVQQGTVKIQIPQKEPIFVRKGQSFGETCFYSEVRVGKAIAAEDQTLLLSIGKIQMEKCLGSNIQKILRLNIQKWSLSRSKLFQNYSSTSIDIINMLFEQNIAQKGDVIMQAGIHPAGLIICIEGKIDNLPRGALFFDDYFGKKNKILGSRLIQTQSGSFAFLSFKNLTKILKQLEYHRWKQQNNKGTQSLKTKIQSLNNKFQSNIKHKFKIQIPSLHNLTLLKIVTQLRYGGIYLVKDQQKSGNSMFLVKVLEKQKIKQFNMKEGVLNQRNIFQKIFFHHIIGYIQSFIDTKYIYFLLEFVDGVPLSHAIQEIRCMNKFVVLYYLCSLLTTIQYLHNQNVIVRNLKPQNISINHQGKIILSNFTSSKILKVNQCYRTYTIIGTPHYMAPQVYQGKGYSFQADYWSLGILLYELVYGQVPFGSNLTDPYQIYNVISTQKINFNKTKKQFAEKDLSSMVNQVIETLLCKNYIDRSTEFLHSKLKQTKLLLNINWNQYTKKNASPYIPLHFRKRNENSGNYIGNNFLQQLYQLKNQARKMAINSLTYQIWDEEQF